MPLQGLTTEEKRALVLSVGTHRGSRALSPVEVAELFAKAIGAGASVKECAQFVSLQPTQVSRFLALRRVPEDVRHLVDWGRSSDTLAFSAAFEISRLESEDDRREAAQAALEHGLGTAEVRQLVQARLRSGKDMTECVRAIVGMRPQLVVRHVLIGAVSDESVQLHLGSLTQQQRDALMRALCEDILRGVGASARLGVHRFTLVGGGELGSALRTKEEIEGAINLRLAAGLRRA